VGIGCITCVVVLFFNDQPSSLIHTITNMINQPVIFLALMIVLPILGFPIIPFLVIAGIKYGTWIAILITTLVIPVHLILSFFVIKSFFRPTILEIFRKTRFPIPRISSHATPFFILLFVALPGAPYVLKNYLLPLSGVPFRLFFPISWIVQLGLAIMVIGFAESAVQLKWQISCLLVAIFLAGYVLMSCLKKRHFRGLD
jgi:uncharacterized membrane protein YdjX (TVP38/TMEM64 family)